MSRGSGWTWAAPAFAHLAGSETGVPLHVRLVTAGCDPNPAEPEQACEERVSATVTAQLAVRQLQAGNLHAGTDLLRAALAAAERAAAVYGQDHHDGRTR